MLNKDEILNDIINNMPKELVKKRDKARYLFLALCMKCRYNDVYRYGEDKNKENFYKKGEYRNYEEEDGYIVGQCNLFAFLLKDLFEKSGIEAKIFRNISSDDFYNRKIYME